MSGAKNFEGRGSVPYAEDRFERTYKTRGVDFGSLITGEARLVEHETDLHQTIETIQRMTADSMASVAALADHLKAKTREQSAFHIWDFVKREIPYKLDKKGVEQVRNPRRSYLDQVADCEDMSIFCACLLKNLGFRPEFVIVSFNGKKEFQHIYTQANGYVLDCVWSRFNEHPPRITKSKIIKLK